MAEINEKTELDNQGKAENSFDSQVVLDSFYSWQDSQSDAIKDLTLPPLALGLLNRLIEESKDRKIVSWLSKNVLPEDLKPILSDIPSFLEIVNFIERLFLAFERNRPSESEFAKIFRSMACAFLKLAVLDAAFFKQSDHSARLLLNELTQLGTTHSTDEPTISELKNITLKFVTVSKNVNQLKALREHFQSQYNLIKQYHESLNKRAKIFEKRTREIARGKATAALAKNWASEAIQHLLTSANCPEFISNTLAESWEHIIFLEKLKEPDPLKLNAIKTVQAIIATVQPPESEEEIEKILSIQPKLYQTLETSLEKSHFSDVKIKQFIIQLSNCHRSLIAKAKQKMAAAESDGIIRLKPVDSMSLELDNKQEEETLSAQAVSEMSDDEWVSAVCENLGAVLNDNLLKANSTPNENSTENIRFEDGEFKVGDWFDWINGDIITRCKIASVISESKLLIFVDARGANKLEISTDEFEAMLNNKQLVAIETTQNFETAYSASVDNAVKRYKQQRLLKQEKQRKAEEKAAFEEKKAKEKEKAAQKRAEEKQQAIQETKDKVIALSVGSWLEYNDGTKSIKCRLAAKIASTEKCILVDRAGVKIIEPSATEMAELIVEGKLQLTIENDRFSQALASVINERRNSKTKHH